ncbi:MAG: XylR family transcriptional regulator [Thermoguttaceae bacterium]
MPETKHILLMIETSKVYGRGLLEGIGRYAMGHGRWSMYVEERSLEAHQPSWLRSWKGDGIIFRSHSRSLVDAVLATGVPAVDTNTAITDHGFPLVYVDETAVAHLACDHFLERRFDHFAFCALGEDPWVRIRRQAYLARLDALGHRCHCLSVRQCLGRRGWDKQREQLARWVRSLPSPVAVLAANDVCATRLINACRSIDVAIPEQVAVLGVDNDTVLDPLTAPPMSSIDLNVARIGYEAAALLDRLMAGEPKPAEPILIKPAGVVARQSTDICAIDDADVATALRFIRHHAIEGIKVADVLDRLCVSRATLERRFTAAIGRSPGEEIRRVRLEQVKQLLTLTDYVLPQIAERTGFKTAAHLSVVFKRQTGLSPSQFRQHTAGFAAN